MANYSQEDLDQVALKLNTRPRNAVGYRTLAAIIQTTVAPTG